MDQKNLALTKIIALKKSQYLWRVFSTDGHDWLVEARVSSKYHVAELLNALYLQLVIDLYTL
jgi:hypothetical protein